MSMQTLGRVLICGSMQYTSACMHVYYQNFLPLTLISFLFHSNSFFSLQQNTITIVSLCNMLITLELKLSLINMVYFYKVIVKNVDILRINYKPLLIMY